MAHTRRISSSPPSPFVPVRGQIGLFWAPAMITIAISVEAFEAIAATLPLGSASFENKTDEEGQRLIWLDRAVVDRLRSLRGAGESWSDVILRVATGETQG